MHVNLGLDDRPRFDTLSYHWSNQENSGHIALNRIEVKVMANLFNALLPLQRPDGSYMDRRFVHQSS